MFKDFIIVIVVAGVIQGSILGIFLIMSKKGSIKANKLLGALLLLFAYVSLINVLLYSEYLLKIPHLAFTQSAFAFLVPPVYYFYLKTLSQKTISFNIKHLIHLMPFFAFLILAMPFFLKSSLQKQEILVNIYNSSNSLRNIPFNKNLFYSIFILQCIPYTYSMIRLNYSVKARPKNLSSLILKTFLIYWLIILTVIVTRVLFFYELITSLALPILLTFGMYALAYWSLLKQGYFLHFFQQNIKYQKAAISEDKMKLLSQKLIHVLEKEHLYRNPNLTAAKLADKISITNHTLSQVINNELNDTFYNLINRMRVNDAVKKLNNNDLVHLSMEGIGIESGFKSKSSFYKAFKKFTNKTPSQFQKAK